VSSPLFIGATPWDLDNGAGLAETLGDQAEAAEKLGLHSLWLPEHHFGGNGAIPSPLLLLAAAAARTQRLRLGTTSYLLPLRHPIQAAEEVAVLDRLSRGRVILGLGRGFRRATFDAFGVPVKGKRDRFEAVLAAMIDAWEGKPVAWEGDDEETRTPVQLAPLPFQKPHPPLWVAAFGPKALAQAGRLGLPYLASPIEPYERLVENHARHREACDEAGREQPSVVPLMRTVFISRDVGVLARASAALQKQASAIARTRGIDLQRVVGAEVDDWAIVGEPERVADGIARYQEAFGMTHLVVRSQIPGVEREQMLSSLELVASLQSGDVG
jgi:alkanesulfonate monooxygenase SsuD/methylene tetrahydromethanopterin reductase-like flavin-dependent oxidoreductase (luciferase family)